MEGLGHFEFGEALRPIGFGSEPPDPAAADRPEFWLRYWADAYEAVLATAGPARGLRRLRPPVARPRAPPRRPRRRDRRRHRRAARQSRLPVPPVAAGRAARGPAVRWSTGSSASMRRSARGASPRRRPCWRRCDAGSRGPWRLRRLGHGAREPLRHRGRPAGLVPEPAGHARPRHDPRPAGALAQRPRARADATPGARAHPRAQARRELPRAPPRGGHARLRAHRRARPRSGARRLRRRALRRRAAACCTAGRSTTRRSTPKAPSRST